MTERTVAVLGLGLIGGSLTAGLSRSPGWRTVGWDPDHGAARYLKRRGWLDHAAHRPAEAVAEADLVVLAGPPRANLDLVSELVGTPAALTVTDVGSVKGDIARRGRALLGTRFVPGHPMAGSERRGARAADPGLFAGARWILCGGGPAHRARVRRLVRAVGAVPAAATPGEHDRDLAAASHLPQVAASVLAAVAGRKDGALRNGGPAFDSFARLAGSSPDLWQEILDLNRDAVLRELEAYVEALRRLQAGWERSGRFPADVLERGNRAHDRWKARGGPVRVERRGKR